LSEDHFVKVRGLIKDLLAKLKADADSEATQKGVCDTGMKKAISHRDEAMAQIEMANAKITTYTANQNTLEDDIRTLHKGISELKKGVYEATENNAEEQAALERVENMSADAINSVKMALNLLKKFYSNALLQTNKYVPPGADRDGNTLDGMAPEVFERDYHASQQESKGIMGILNIIVTDFERVKAKALADEAYVKAAFIKLKNPLTGDIALKEKEIKRKTAKVSDTKSDIIDQQQALADAQDLLEGATDALDSLKTMCVAGEETWAERTQKRKDEIQALKDAMDIFRNWQS
jgi:DNA repair exonuclease SbcCD ATPase subunit